MKLRSITVWIIGLIMSAQTLADGPIVNVDEYPSLDAKQIGHLRQFVKLSRQLPGDWSEMGEYANHTSEKPYRYQLAFMLYAAASVQFNITPAYRELYQDLIGRLLVQLRHYDIWGNWVNASRGGGWSDPKSISELDDGWIDPIKKHNIMYSAHLMQGAATYEALYRTGEFMQPGSLTLVWPQTLWGPGAQTFEYSLPKIADNFLGQFRENDYMGIPCEPNALFPECPQHAVLGLMLYDQVAGTGYAAEIMPRYMEQFEALKYLDEETGSFMAAWKVKQGEPFYFASGIDGWTGTFMHAWAPEYVKRVYPRQRDLHVDKSLNSPEKPGGPPIGASSELGFMAMMASEVGDSETVAKILAHADKYYGPVWREGRYYYPRNDGPVSVDDPIKAVSALAGNAMLAFARLNPKNGLFNLHNNIWSESHFELPYITSVDLGAVGVRQAIYDTERAALIVGFEPGPLGLSETQFEVRNLDPASAWNVYKDGALVGTLREGNSAPEQGFDWPAAGSARITMDPTEPVSLVLKKRETSQTSVSP